MAKKALVFLAEGFEEVEAVTPIDYLRRAGVEVTIASVGAQKTVKGAHGIGIAADACAEDLLKQEKLVPALWDAVFVPGGQPGADNLAASSTVGGFFRAMKEAGKITAAICASPAVVLAPLGLLENKKFTCYPGAEKQVKSGSWSQDRVVADGSLITSRAPGTAGEFALALIEALEGKDAAKKVGEAALLQIVP